VLQEHYRTSSRSQPIEDSHLEASGKVLNLEGLLIAEETSRRVRDVLKSLPERDRNVLRAIFLEEKEKDEVCSQFGVDRNYLRVLLHRAKDKFRQALGESNPPLAKAREGAAR
jgi:RNA polymerase sigma-70 factor (ECF subfamily)